MKKFYSTLIIILCWGVNTLLAQEQKPKELNPWLDFSINGEIQSDMHLSIEKNPEHRFMSNNYLSLKVQNKYLETGLRMEYLQQPLPGFNKAKGYGMPNYFLKLNYQNNSLTLGDCYGQFGSGMLLRLYEDRYLGIDNALRGAKLVCSPIGGLRLKLLGGQQRNHFDRPLNTFYNKSRSYLWGADVEVDLQEYIAWLKQSDYSLQCGLSYVSKYEKSNKDLLNSDGTKYLNQPSLVGAVASRLHLLVGNWDIYNEFAFKPNDPSLGNNYHYGAGSVEMLTASYTQRGFSLMLGARRSENFDFRSSRSADLADLRINHLLPFTLQQTYALAALYPYATQSKGEWAFQGEVRYKLKKKTWWGGRYGTHIRLSASYIRGLQAKDSREAHLLTFGGDKLVGTDGVKTNFFGFGEKLFHDFNIEVARKINKAYGFTLIYMNQSYNQEVLEGHAENGKQIRSHIFIYDGKHKLSKNIGLRTELQYFHSKQAKGDWFYAGVETSILPHFMVSLSDLANIGGKHYLMLSLAGTYKSHRLQLGIGETRQGINCSGGVCRMMPATKGFNLNYTMNF